MTFAEPGDLTQLHKLVGAKQNLGILLPACEFGFHDDSRFLLHQLAGLVLLIALEQVVDIDMTPATSTLVDNLNDGLLV